MIACDDTNAILHPQLDSRNPSLAIILLIIAIAGGVIVHPLVLALAIVALVLFFVGR